jgi:hypothetical protein
MSTFWPIRRGAPHLVERIARLLCHFTEAQAAQVTFLPSHLPPHHFFTHRGPARASFGSSVARLIPFVTYHLHPFLLGKFRSRQHLRASSSDLLLPASRRREVAS